MMGPGHVGPGHVVPGHVHCRPIVLPPESQRGHACSEQEWGRRSEHGRDTESNAPFHALCRVPTEVVEGSIAPHLTASDLCSMAAVCRCWHRMASSDSLWQQRCENTFRCHPPIAASGENGGGEDRGDGGRGVVTGEGGGRGGKGGEAARWKGLFGALALARAQWGGRVERLVARGVDCSSEWGEWRVQGIGCGGDGGIWCSEVRNGDGEKVARRAAESKRHGKACGGRGEFLGVALAHPLCAVAGVVVTPAPLYGSSRAAHLQVEVGFSATSFHYTSPPIRLSSDWLQPHTLALPPAALVAGSHLRIHLTGLNPLTACHQQAGGGRDGGEEEGRLQRGDEEGGGGEEELGEKVGEDGVKQFVCLERVEVFGIPVGGSLLSSPSPSSAASSPSAAAVERVERELVLSALRQQPCFHATMARWIRPRAGEPLDAAEVIMALRSCVFAVAESCYPAPQIFSPTL
ncbi:unnamed protein product [Closterium sp. Naga37s-1]|nr:unnamed protein product [Closterium sp. Naga37s-1]